MNIKEDQIKLKSVAGKTEDGRPVMYVLSKGGLHMFFTTTKDGKPEALAAAPHIAIARHFAEKKCPIKWGEEYMLKSEPQYDAMLKYFHSVDLPIQKSEEMKDVWMVWNTKPSNKGFEIMDSKELIKGIKDGVYDCYDMVRPLDLSKKDSLIEDSDDFKEFLKA
jgi:hypothetical protein